MLYHLIHRTFLQELSFLITILAVVIACAAICVCPTVLILREWHTATLAKLRQLTRLQGFLFSRERGFVGLVFPSVIYPRNRQRDHPPSEHDGIETKGAMLS